MSKCFIGLAPGCSSPGSRVVPLSSRVQRDGLLLLAAVGCDGNHLVVLELVGAEILDIDAQVPLRDVPAVLKLQALDAILLHLVAVDLQGNRKL